MNIATACSGLVMAISLSLLAELDPVWATVVGWGACALTDVLLVGRR